MTVRFIHVTTPDAGNVTLAIRKIYEEGSVWEVGAAFCSPTEKHFIRKLGRQIAQGRLLSRRHGYATFSRPDDSAPLSLKESPLEVLDILRRVSAKEYGQQGEPGPTWWNVFMSAARGEYDLHQARIFR